MAVLLAIAVIRVTLRGLTVVTGLKAPLRASTSLTIKVGQTVSKVLYNGGKNEESWIKGANGGTTYSPLGGTLTKAADHLFADPVTTPNDDNAVSWVYSDIIDFSGYTKLVIESASQENVGLVSIILTPEIQLDTSNLDEYYEVADNGAYPRRTDTFDVSAISGESYLHLVARDNSLNTEYPTEVEFYYIGLK